MTVDAPARKAIRLLGVKQIAHECGLTTDAVHKWAYRGRGLIPSDHLAGVLALATRLGQPLTAEDLIGEARP